MKKAAVCLFGMSKMESYDHWSKTCILTIDYRYSVNNYKANLLNYLTSEGYIIDIFVSTYHSDIEHELLKDYNPKRHTFTKFDSNLSNHFGRNWHVINVLNLAKSYATDNKFVYDICVLTRFDMMFKKNLREYRILHDKLNISFVLEHLELANPEDNPRIDDNLYIIPAKYMHAYISFLSSLDLNITHHIMFNKLARVINKKDINFMVDGFIFMTNNPIYYLVRNKKTEQIKVPQEAKIIAPFVPPVIPKPDASIRFNKTMTLTKPPPIIQTKIPVIPLTDRRISKTTVDATKILQAKRIAPAAAKSIPITLERKQPIRIKPLKIGAPQ